MGESIVVLNRRARGGRAHALAGEARDWLAAQAPGVGLIESSEIAEMSHALATLAPSSRVVLIGGDGTIHNALPMLLERHHSLGIVPFGSGDDAARALSVRGVSWQTALRRALSGVATPMDLGCAEFGGKCVPFIVCANAGLDAAVSLRALNGPRFLHGLPRYLLATIRELLVLRNWPIDAEIDGKTFKTGDALFASALNTPSFGSGMPAVPAAQIDDGALDVLHAANCSRLRTAILLPKLLRGTHLSDPRVSTQRCRELLLRSHRPIPIAADGEYLGESIHIRITVMPNALAVVRGG